MIQKNVRSLKTSDRIKEIVREVEGYKWGALLQCETWRPKKAEMWESHQRHIILWVLEIREKSRCWNTSEQEVAKKDPVDCIHQRTCYCNTDHGQQAKNHVDECSLPSHEICGPSCRTSIQINREIHQIRENIQIVGGDFNAELGLGIERLSVGQYTLRGTNKRGDWMKQWLMVQKFVALNAIYKYIPDKQVTYRTSIGAEKQLDHVLVDRKNLKHSRNAEANDMIHMGSGHRSILTQVVIPVPKKNDSQKRIQSFKEESSKGQHNGSDKQRNETRKDHEVRRAIQRTRKKNHQVTHS